MKGPVCGFDWIPAGSLGNSQDDESSIHAQLRRWGFQGFTVGFASFLDPLIASAPTFLELAGAFPSLRAQQTKDLLLRF